MAAAQRLPARLSATGGPARLAKERCAQEVPAAMGPKTLLLLLLLLPSQGDCQGAPWNPLGLKTLYGDGDGEVYWLRLCGRDFLRAVAFTCGGSRFKRVSAPEPKPPPPPPEFVQMNSDNGLENIKLQSVLDPILNELQPTSQLAWQQSMKDLFNSYDNEHFPTSKNFNEYIHQAKDVPRNRDEARMANSMGSSYLSWGKYSRRKRGFPSGLAAVCCRWGCGKNELNILC